MNGGTVINKAEEGWVFDNYGTFNFKAGTINLDVEGGSTSLYNSSGTINMTGGSVLSKGFGLCVDGGRVETTGGSIQASKHWAVLVRNTGVGRFTNTTILGNSGYGINNEISDYSNVIVKSRASNYGITGTIGGKVIATTNTGPGQSSETVMLFNPPSDWILFPTWTEKNGQDDIDWFKGFHLSNTQASSGYVAYTYVKKSNHNNETGKYNVHMYEANSSWQAVKGIATIELNF